MADEPEEALTSWKQFRVRTSLGTLVSILAALGLVLWQGMEIRTQIDGNSSAVEDMAYAVEGLTGAVSLANELDTRTNILFGEIDSLRDQYQDQADVWIEISTQEEQIDTIRNEARILRTDIESTWNQQNEFRMEVVERVAEFDLVRGTISDLEWQVGDLDRRVAEAFGAEMAGGSDDYGYQITDLIRQVAELQGRANAGVDIEWQLEDLENSVDWDIDEIDRRIDDLESQIRDSTGGIGRSEVDEMWDLLRRMFYALETQDWSHDHLYD